MPYIPATVNTVLANLMLRLPPLYLSDACEEASDSVGFEASWLTRKALLAATV
jgi:hypothetical protein